MRLSVLDTCYECVRVDVQKNYLIFLTANHETYILEFSKTEDAWDAFHQLERKGFAVVSGCRYRNSEFRHST